MNDRSVHLSGITNHPSSLVSREVVFITFIDEYHLLRSPLGGRMDGFKKSRNVYVWVVESNRGNRAQIG